MSNKYCPSHPEVRLDKDRKCWICLADQMGFTVVEDATMNYSAQCKSYCACGRRCTLNDGHVPNKHWCGRNHD